MEKKKEFNVFEFLNKQALPIIKRSRKWLFVPAITLLLGFFLGYSGEKKKKPLFSAKITYMLEDEIIGDGPKSGGNSQILAALSGQSSGNNKNVMVELSISNKLIESTLFRTVDMKGKKEVLANYYIEKMGYRDAWKGNDKLAKLAYPENYTIGTNDDLDYWIRVFSNAIKLNLISKVQESGLIRLDFSSNDELFTKMFVENHLKTISDFYINKKVERAQNLVDFAKKKRDSLLSVLQGKTYGAAAAVDNRFGAVMRRAFVAEAQMNRDVAIVTEQYKESVLALSTASIDLERRKPFISVVDDVRLPLLAVWPEPTKKGVAFGLVGFVLGLALVVGTIMGIDFLKAQKQQFQTTNKL